VQWKRVYSLALDEMVRIRMTTQALHQIDASGGIDEYLLNTPDEKLNSDVGIKLRNRVLGALKKRNKESQSQEISEMHGVGVREPGLAVEGATDSRP
jgi:ribosomal protein L28